MRFRTQSNHRLALRCNIEITAISPSAVVEALLKFMVMGVERMLDHSQFVESVNCPKGALKPQAIPGDRLVTIFGRVQPGLSRLTSQISQICVREEMRDAGFFNR